MSDPQPDLARIWSSIAGGAPAGPAEPSGLFLPDPEHPFAEILGMTAVRERRSLPLLHVYLTASEYLPGHFAALGVDYRPDLVRLDLLYQHPRDEMLGQLAVLNHIATDDQQVESVRAEFVRRVPAIEPHLTAGLAGADGKSRELLARGPILRTIRDVLAEAEIDQGSIEARRATLSFPTQATVPLLVAALLLVHLTGDLLGAKSNASEPIIGGLPRSLAMELVQNSLFNRSEDFGDLLARSHAMWHDSAIASLPTPPRRAPRELVNEASAADYDELLAAAYALYAYAQNYTVTSAQMLAPDALCFNTPAHTAEVFGVFAATPEELAAEVRAGSGDWQMLPLQNHPVVQVPTGYLVLDEVYLADRVTSGLFWLVHDYEKQQGGEQAAQDWRVAHGGMFELLAEHRIRRLTPPLLGAGKSAYFSEEDLKSLFPGEGRKHCDIGIDFGRTVLLADAVGGQVSVPTRTVGDATALEKDLERIVFKKTRQLDDTARRLLEDQPATRALLDRVAPRIHPIVIHAGQFPHSPPVAALIQNQLQTEGLLAERDARIAPLCVLSIEDLEVAEIVRQRNATSLPDLLDAWHQSDYQTTTLRNYLIETYALRGPLARSESSKAELDAVMRLIEPVIDRARKP